MCDRCDSRPLRLARKVYKFLKESGYSWNECGHALNTVLLAMASADHGLPNPLEGMHETEVSRPPQPNELDTLSKSDLHMQAESLLKKKGE